MDRWVGNLSSFVWATSLGVTALGCSSVALEETGFGAERVDGAGAVKTVAPRLSSSWIGYRAGASPGTWRDLGKLPKSGSEQAMPIVPKDVNAAGRARGTSTSAVILDYAGERVYHWDVPRESLEKITKFRESQARNTAPSGSIVNAGVAPEPEVAVAPLSWSNGVDTRVARGIYEAGVAGIAHRKIGMMVGQTPAGDFESCTGTLVGGSIDGWHYVATAAHCLFGRGTGSNLTLTFEPRRDSCQDAALANIPECDVNPYGMWDKAGSALVSEYFYTNCRGAVSLQPHCIAEDTAIFIVRRPAGEADPGAMAFRRATTASLSNWTLRAWGYPNCYEQDDPDSATCRAYTLYGDTLDCAVSGFAEPDENGQMRYGKHSCDTSPGMSGTALFANLSSYGYTVLGISSAGAGSGATPNSFRVNTTAWVDLFWAYADI